MEDDQGVTITKMKDRVQSKSWLERIFSEKTIDLDQLTSTSDNASNLRDQWEVNAKRIEDYFQYLLCFNFDEVEELHHENDTSQASPLDSEMQELAKSNMVARLLKTLFFPCRFNQNGFSIISFIYFFVGKLENTVFFFFFRDY